MAYAIAHVGAVVVEETLLPLVKQGRLLDRWPAKWKLSGGISPLKSASRQESITDVMRVLVELPPTGLRARFGGFTSTSTALER